MRFSNFTAKIAPVPQTLLTVILSSVRYFSTFSVLNLFSEFTSLIWSRFGPGHSFYSIDSDLWVGRGDLSALGVFDRDIIP